MSQLPSTLENLVNQFPDAQLINSKEKYPHTSHQDGGLTLLEINNQRFSAVFAPQGAHLIEFTSKESDSLLWLSPKAVFKPGKAIRGGIPVCLPWFGAHPSDNTKPSHGFVRDANWQLTTLKTIEDDKTLITWRFNSTEQTLELFPHSFYAELSFVLGDDIEIELNVKNSSTQDMPVSWALHSYFPTDNLDSTQVTGLEGIKCSNLLLDKSCCQLDTPITFNGEVDQVYEQVPSEQKVQVPNHKDIIISGSNCPTCIVWNPGVTLGASMADIGDNNHQGFVCVERGAALGDTWQLAPEKIRTAKLIISRAK